MSSPRSASATLFRLWQLVQRTTHLASSAARRFADQDHTRCVTFCVRSTWAGVARRRTFPPYAAGPVQRCCLCRTVRRSGVSGRPAHGSSASSVPAPTGGRGVSRTKPGPTAGWCELFGGHRRRFATPRRAHRSAASWRAWLLPSGPDLPARREGRAVHDVLARVRALSARASLARRGQARPTNRAKTVYHLGPEVVPAVCDEPGCRSRPSPREGAHSSEPNVAHCPRTRATAVRAVACVAIGVRPLAPDVRSGVAPRAGLKPATGHPLRGCALSLSYRGHQPSPTPVLAR